METQESIRTRMSIRQFKPDPLPKEVLMELIDTAKWSPSYKNSQPWEVILVSGAKKDALSKMLVDLLERGEKPQPDLDEPASWPEPCATRIKEYVLMRARATGRDMNDPEVLKQAKRANFNFYGAPHVIYLYQHGRLPLWSLLDMGLFAQSLMLAARAKGIGTVPQAFATDYAKDIKRFLSIPEEMRLVLGISIGYPDMDAPTNKFRSHRIETTEIVRWVE